MIAIRRRGYYSGLRRICEIFAQDSHGGCHLSWVSANPLKRAKQFLFGKPLPSERLEHERLNKKTALAVLSSDAISSVAYATDQILIVLAVLGTAAAVH